MNHNISDPAWKSGPPEPKHRHSEHRISSAGHDLNGVGRKEAEQIEGEPLMAVREAFVCSREGCDADPSVTYLYGERGVSRRVRQACGWATDPDWWYEYFCEHCEIVDWDGGPILGVRFGDDTLGYVTPQTTIEDGFGGACYGRSEPSPDVNAYRYDL